MGEAAFGHPGRGGSMGFADPDARLSFGYVMNDLGLGVLVNARGQRLIDAAGEAATVDAAGVASNFERMVRIADGTGIPLGDRLENGSAEVRAALDLERFLENRT